MQDASFALMTRIPARRLFKAVAGCESCLWSSVLVEVRSYPLDVDDPRQADRWYMECDIDHEPTDRHHGCALHQIAWAEYWKITGGDDSAHAKAERLRIKLATYRWR